MRQGGENLKGIVFALNEFESAVISGARGGDGPRQRHSRRNGQLADSSHEKGLEFNNNILPELRKKCSSHHVDDGGGAALEGVRHPSYVELTRADAECGYAALLAFGLQPVARLRVDFIDELPEDLVEHRVEAGLYGGVAEPDLEALEKQRNMRCRP